MSRHIIVRDLTGGHLGMRITITTDHTKATGILQGFEHEGSIITNLTYGGTEYVPGATTTHLTIFPNQRIIADFGDEVVVHDDEDAAGLRRYADGGIVKEGDPGTSGPGWQVGDTAHYCGMVDGKHVYMSQEAAERAGIESQPVTVVDG